MTKEQWQTHAFKIIENYYGKVIGTTVVSQDNWHMYKSALIEYIKNIDDLTEVYNMENKGKSDV